MGMKLKKTKKRNEEKDNENINCDNINCETRRRFTFSANVGSLVATLGSLIGGAASVAKAVNDSKAATSARGAATS